MHINQNTLFSVYITKYNLFFLNSRSAVFLLSPHLSSCEICAQKDNRIKFSQDNICFAECIPDTGHHPAPGGRESEVPALQFKPPKHSKSSSWFQRSHYRHFFLLDTSWPPPLQEIRTNRMCSVFSETAASAYIFHLKLLSIWLIHLWTPPVDC